MIDWSEKIECNHGDINRHWESHSSQSRMVSIDSVSWKVSLNTGEPVDEFMNGSFAVRNKKTNRDKAMEILGCYWNAAPDPKALREKILNEFIQADLLKDD